MKYVTIATFASRLEAETVAHALDPHRIPYLIQGHDIGMLGAAGAVPGGVKLQVPDFVAEQVEALLECVVRSRSGRQPATSPDGSPPTSGRVE